MSLFPEGEREGGTGVVISPIAVNDNLVDITAGPGPAPGAPATLTLSPDISYLRFLTTADGRRLAFARFVNNVAVPSEGDAIKRVTGQTLGELAAAAYEAR